MIARNDNIAARLNERRKQLGMCVRILAQRAGLSVCTAQRALTGKSDQRMGTLLAIASALEGEVSVRFPARAAAVREKAASEKSRAIVRNVQGNFALEGQAVPPSAKRRVESQIKRKLLHGPNIRLWS